MGQRAVAIMYSLEDIYIGPSEVLYTERVGEVAKEFGLRLVGDPKRLAKVLRKCSPIFTS